MVHETMLCQRDGIYGRLKRVDSDGNELGDVVDVTAPGGTHSYEVVKVHYV